MRQFDCVWSDAGGRGRRVTIVRPRWWASLGASALWGRDPRWATLQYGLLSAVALALLPAGLPLYIETIANWPEFAAAVGDSVAAVFIMAVATLLLLLMVGWIVQLVRVAPDIVGRSSVEGRVVLWKILEGRHTGGEEPAEPDTFWVAVDDGRSETAPAYRVSGNLIARLKLGDRVRLTVGRLHGFVFRVEMLDVSTGAASPVDSTPELHGAPIEARELERTFHRAVRSIEGPVESAGGTVRTWTYHLGYGTSVENESTIRVHLASGTDGFNALAGAKNRDAPPQRTWVERMIARSAASGRGRAWSPGYDKWRFGDLLVFRRGELVIGFEQAPAMNLLKWYENEGVLLALRVLKRWEREGDVTD